MTALTVRSPLPFFAARQSYPLTPTQSLHRTDSPIHPSTRAYIQKHHLHAEICDAEGPRWSLRAPAGRHGAGAQARIARESRCRTRPGAAEDGGDVLS